MGVVCIVLVAVGVVDSRYMFLWAWFTIEGRRRIFQVTPPPKTRNWKKAVSLGYFLLVYSALQRQVLSGWLLCYPTGSIIFFKKILSFMSVIKITYSLLYLQPATSHDFALSAPCTICSWTLLTITLPILKITKAAQNKHFHIIGMCWIYYSSSRTAL